ncbi:MAG: ABC transporter permease [Pirellulaceae bacterium]|nr:ABC transporter permease [Pirellulaceae bacterium]
MANPKPLNRFQALTGDYGMIVVLLGLMAILSLATLDLQQPVGMVAGRQVAESVNDRKQPRNILLITAEGKLDFEFADAFENQLQRQHKVLARIQGGPRDARLTLEKFAASPRPADTVVCTTAAAKWDPILQSKLTRITPDSYYWPDFLMTDNLVTIAQRITIIGIIAIGMTMVIITAGIDLSVGSLIALSAVVTGVLIRDCFGGKEADFVGLWVAAGGGILACGLAGFLTGFLVAAFRLPPFIVTLAMMLLVRGVANVISDQRTIHEIPMAFDTLGKGNFLGIPITVWLMFMLYILAHFVMSRTALGRQIYAVGGNEEVARLAGVRVKRILLIVYTLCGLLSGIGGVIVTSQLRSAKASFGMMDELTVIAAVVVGGTSLMGGEGKILGTLIGAFIIGVIQNGMNLVHMDDKTQMIVLGLVIVLAVLVDRVKKGQVKWSDIKNVFHN